MFFVDASEREQYWNIWFKIFAIYKCANRTTTPKERNSSMRMAPEIWTHEKVLDTSAEMFYLAMGTNTNMSYAQ